MTLAVVLRDSSNVEEDEFRSVVTSAILSDLQHARLRMQHFARECNVYEVQYGLDSDAFLVAFEDGSLGDDEPLFSWFAAKQGLDYWSRRVEILAGASVEPI